MKVKAVYESEVLKPLSKLDLKEGEEVDIEIKKRTDRESVADRTYGLVSLDHEDIEEIIKDTENEPQ